MNYPHPLIAREGWPFIVGALVLAILASSVGLWSLPFWLLLIFCLQFFRDPPRAVAGGPKSVLSPADGRVVVVEETDDPYLNRRALKVSVFMNVFNVHSNRAPIESTVEQKWYQPGSFLNASLAKASLENERCALHLKTSDGRDVTCVQIAGLVARRILNYVEAGASLTPGQRFGFIRFGSRLDVYLP
ncbi:MAG: phosphatidylserine decarboxylase, partial [Propionivibrio sp.]